MTIDWEKTKVDLPWRITPRKYEVGMLIRKWTPWFSINHPIKGWYSVGIIVHIVPGYVIPDITHVFYKQLILKCNNKLCPISQNPPPFNSSAACSFESITHYPDFYADCGFVEILGNQLKLF